MEGGGGRVVLHGRCFGHGHGVSHFVITFGFVIALHLVTPPFDVSLPFRFTSSIQSSPMIVIPLH